MEQYATVDESSFPLVSVTFTGNKSTDENFQAYLNQVKASYRKEEKLALIFDASTASVPGFSHQKMQADWLKENETLMKSYCAGTAYIIPNLVIRGILKMIFSIQKQPVPYRIFEKKEDGVAWLREGLT